MDARARTLIEQSDKLFSQRSSLVSLWQEQAEMFYPERADFTVTRNVGQDFATHLTTSVPLLARRELGNMMAGMLRPSGSMWAKCSVFRDDRLDTAGRQWLDMASHVQRRAMYDRQASLGRAATETDHDFITFGQGVMSATYNRLGTGLIHRNHHLRDVVWSENAEGKPDRFARKWKAQVRNLIYLFRDKVHAKVKEAKDKEPFREIECRHEIVPADQYQGGKKTNAPYWSVYVDVENGHIMEELPYWNTYYIVPRFQTVSGSQYAYSPATIAALPDARLIQSITLTLLEAGEKAANPAMVGVKDAIMSDATLYPGGITWIDKEYDQKTGDPFRPIKQDFSGLPVGFNLQQQVREHIAEAFFLNKIQLPPLPSGATAYEAAQRVAEYVRQALPLFEPIEQDYNGQLCDIDFDLLMRAGAFGPPSEIPESLQGQDVQFRFENPLSEARGEQSVQQFLKAKQLLAEAAEMDPDAVRMVDVKTSLRDVLENTIPAKWMLSADQVDEAIAEAREAQAGEKLMQDVGTGAAVAEQLGKASQALAA